jgi:DNA-binding LacI/PurR family transcriptional regulator
MFAQGMRGLSTGVIGMIHFTSFLQSSVQREIFMAQAIAEKGHRVITADAIAPHNAGAETSFYRLLVDQMIDFRVDGVILSSIPGIMPPEEIWRLKDANIPCVSLSGVPFAGIPYVGADLEQGMHILTEHLIRQGYHTPVMIVQELSSNPLNPTQISVNPRLRGFTSALEAHGGEVVFLNDPDNPNKLKKLSETAASQLRGYVFSSSGSQKIEDTYAVGYHAFNKMQDMGVAADVVLMPNDDWLQGAMQAAKQRCLRVPEQIGLTGFDATPYGQYGWTRFTSVAQPLREMAQKTVDMMFSIIEGEIPLNDPATLLKCTLVPGETTVQQAAP